MKRGQEFVNCLTSNPLLSETLRQLATTDNSTKNVPEGVPINLDVTIADPTKDIVFFGVGSEKQCRVVPSVLWILSLQQAVLYVLHLSRRKQMLT